MERTALDRRNVALLWVLILSAYLLVYTNAPISIDGADTLDVAATLLQHGKPAATRITTSRQLIEANAEQEFYTLSPDGERYSKKGVTPSLALLPFVGLAQLTPALSTRATAMLFNPLVTMLTVWQLYVFARFFKATPNIAAVLALIFAFATMSIIYVKTLFGEPLAGLLLLVAFYHCAAYAQDMRRLRSVLVGAALALALGINLSYALLVVPFGLYLVWSCRDWRAGVYYLLPVALMLGFLAYWNILRYGSPFNTGYGLANNVEGFTTPVLYGVIGLWLSFYKGVFWFQPILFAGLFGLPKAWRAHRPLLILALAVTAVHTITYATWWAWDGAWSWGGRFMLPLLPVMLLSLLPALNAARHSRRIRRTLIGLCAVSFLLQVPGILYSYIPFYETVFDGQLFRWQNHAALAAFAGLFESAPHPALLSERFDRVHAVVVAAGALVGLFAVLRLRGRLRTGAIVAALATSCLIVAARQQSKPSFALVREFYDTLTAGSTVYIQSFEFDTRLLDVDNMRLIVANPHAPQENPLVARQWQLAQDWSSALWLVTWFPPASAENWAERALWQRYPFVEQGTVGGHRALRFEMTAPPDAVCPSDAVFDTGLALRSYGTHLDPSGLAVTLYWQAHTAPAADYSWFVHLLNENGQIVRQQDRVPAGGYLPTSAWQPDQTVSDYLFFPLPESLSLDRWTLRIGLVDPATGQPRLLEGSSGSPFVILPLDCSN